MAEVKLQPRKWQREFFKNCKRFNVLMVHRRAGKTVAAVMYLIMEALKNTKPNPSYAYAAPEKDQGERIVWRYFKYYLEGLPGVKLKESAKEVHFSHNNANISIVGLKNIEALRGRYFDGIIVDEYSDAPADGFGTIIYPALLDRKGWALITGTPKGMDHFYELFQKAAEEGQDDWYSCRYTVHDTGVFNEEEIDKMHKVMTNAQFAQEMLCDFYADFSNKYYLELIKRAEEQGRVGDFSYNIKYPVYTAWDLGTDCTAIWFAQRIHSEFMLIDYWEKMNSKLPEALQAVLNKGYVYAGHFLPHDSVHEHVESEASSFQQIKTILGKSPTLLPRISRSEGIRLAQNSLIKCKFDRKTMDTGLASLKNYQAKIDKKKQINLEEHVHDRFSHGADAFRYLIQGLGMKKNDTYDLRQPLIKADYDPLTI